MRFIHTADWHLGRLFHGIHLTDDQRHVVELRLAGLSDHEIAEVLGRKYATVRTIQRRALIRLQALLGVTAEPAGEARDADG